MGIPLDTRSIVKTSSLEGSKVSSREIWNEYFGNDLHIHFWLRKQGEVVDKLRIYVPSYIPFADTILIHLDKHKIADISDEVLAPLMQSRKVTYEVFDGGAYDESPYKHLYAISNLFILIYPNKPYNQWLPSEPLKNNDDYLELVNQVLGSAETSVTFTDLVMLSNKLDAQRAITKQGLTPETYYKLKAAMKVYND